MTEKEKMEAYWRSRSEKLFISNESNILNYAKNLEKQYEQAKRAIEEKINSFYGKYQTATGMDMTTVRKLLDKSELKSFKSYLNELVDYAKDHKFDKTYRQDIQLLKLKTNISRMEELKTQIQFEVEKLNKKVEASMKEELSNVYEDGYYKTIFNTTKKLGFSMSFNMLNTKAIEKAVATEYMAENYSQALWKNKNRLLTILNKEIPQGIILGKNPKTAVKKLDTNYNSTVRLVRTEYNLILNDAVGQGLKQCGIDKYEIVATLDSRTSDICISLDGKVFDVSQKEIGINYPPFHPNCRTTVAAYFEYDEIDEMFNAQYTRLAKDKDGNYYKVPANLTYKEWQKGLTTQKNGTTAYTN